MCKLTVFNLMSYEVHNRGEGNCLIICHVEDQCSQQEFLLSAGSAYDQIAPVLRWAHPSVS